MIHDENIPIVKDVDIETPGGSGGTSTKFPFKEISSEIGYI